MKTLNNLIDEAKGELVLDIGRGDFKATLDGFMRSAHSMGYKAGVLEQDENSKYVTFVKKKNLRKKKRK